MDNGVCIIESDEDLIAHEKALYRNFYRTYPAYSRRFFQIIDKNRLKPNIPYESQAIYGVKHAGMLISAGSFTIDPSQKYEIEHMGFVINKTDSVCEGLHFYSTISETVGFNMTVYRNLLQFAFRDILKRNISTVYSSCSEKLIKLYRYIGFEIIDDIIFEGEKEFLIRMEITQDFEKEIFKLERML